MNLRKVLEPIEPTLEYKNKLRKKILEIEELLNRRESADIEIKEFNKHTDSNYDSSHFCSYQGFESLKDFVNNVSLSKPKKIPDITKDELVEIAKRIMDTEKFGDYKEYYMELFDINVPMPEGSNLIFYPENYNSRRDNLDGYNPTPEEIVEKALKYKPFICES